MTCVDCSCIPTEQVTGNAGALSTDLPIAALAAGVTVPWRRNNGDLYHMILLLVMGQKRCFAYSE